MQLLSLLLGDMRLLNKLAHTLARLRHLQNLLLLLGYIRVKLAGDGRIEHSLLVGYTEHSAKLGLDSLQLIHLINLLRFHLLVL